MATHTQTQKTRVGTDVELELEDDEEEVEKLEEEVNEMAQKILHYRSSLPDQLKSSLTSILATQRPPLIGNHFHSSSDSEPGPSGNTDTDAGRPSEPGNGTSLEMQAKEKEKIAVLKQKISSNASHMPIVLKRMKDCMARIDQLESSEVIIHPAFKRKRTSGLADHFLL